MRVDDVAGDGAWQTLLATSMDSFDSRNEASKCASMTWQAISGRPPTVTGRG